jgi:catechol 2,3-dioxygenase-like lactoylglutathione lyase family enzyme
MSFVIEGVNHHGITVSDLDRSLEFFVGVLGFEPGPTVDLDEEFSSGVTGVGGARIKVAFVRGPGIDVELLQYLGPDDRRAVDARPCDVGSAHLALFVDDIAAVVSASEPAGWRLAGVVQPITTGPRAGGSAAYLRDADGITIELVERPVSAGAGRN